LNDQSIDLSELDDRYARQDHTHSEFAEIDAELDQLREDLANILPPEPLPPETPDGDLELARSGQWIIQNVGANSSDTMLGDGFKYTPTSDIIYLGSSEAPEAVYPLYYAVDQIKAISLPEKMPYLDSATGLASPDTLVTNWQEELKPGDFVRLVFTAYDKNAKVYYDHDMVLILGDWKYRGTGSQNKYPFHMFEVTEVRNADEAVKYLLASSGLCQTYRDPENHCYVNTMEVDFGGVYVTPDRLEERLEEEREITDSDIADVQSQLDFIEQEVNHLVPISAEGGWNPSSSGTASGNFTAKRDRTTHYGAWVQEINRLEFNCIDGEGIDHTEALGTVSIGDKIECYIAKDNYFLCEVTKLEVAADTGRLGVLVNAIRFEGEGFSGQDKGVNWEFFQGDLSKPYNLREQLYGYYHYKQAKASAGINLNNLHEHPGRYVCLNSAGDVVDTPYSGVSKMVFAQLDEDGKRPPRHINTGNYESKKFTFWNLMSLTLKDGELIPAYSWDAKSYSEPFYYNSVLNSFNEQLPAIKFPAVNYAYVMTSEELYFKWPI
jgi:hypothetical protein